MDTSTDNLRPCMRNFVQTPFKGVPSKVQMPMGSSRGTGLIPKLWAKTKSKKSAAAPLSTEACTDNNTLFYSILEGNSNTILECTYWGYISWKYFPYYNNTNKSPKVCYYLSLLLKSQKTNFYWLSLTRSGNFLKKDTTQPPSLTFSLT